MHVCDNPLCVRPDHLREGSLSDNSVDMTTKGRNCQHSQPDSRPRGEKHGGSKLTENDVRSILASLDAKVPKRHLARRFGVSEGEIRRIGKRTKWGWLKI